MLLKIVVPQINRTIQGGFIRRWHKNEGELIDYGEDIVNIFIDKNQFIMPLLPPISILSNLSEPDSTVNEIREFPYGVMRIISMDRGFLRSILVKESEYRSIGEVLALITTNENEPIVEIEKDSTKISTFRVTTDRV
ncbi:lipoyl domain-containing protein [Calothrix sp. PCC 7507]|uniref:lipoyl domain-containing protein n=1 Tax=Calothrix sp. PCC 7507 TaxID=99598 RepID=UPI00029F043A|nr:lipoyl domain-containing protein [Calothrix sp. PCC 7507]AFY35395.1 hypothetical protein Cal7507_5049 [Calothrix sp. PCC 7507]